MTKNKRISLAGWLFYSIAIFILMVGFVGLFAKQFKFNIPYITDVMFPIFDKYSIKVPGWGTTGSYTEVVSGEHWVFLILLGLAIIVAIIGKQLSNVFLHLAAQRKRKAKKRTRTKVKKHTLQSKSTTPRQSSQKPIKANSEKEANKKAEPTPEPAGRHKNFADLTKGLNSK